MNTNSSSERVPLRIKLFYGVGAVAEGTKNTTFNVFLLFYYNQILGVSGTLSGVAIFLALCVDALTDPIVGSLSDNFHSRWGRRHPFMYNAPLPMAVCFFLLFNPPSGLSQSGYFLWLTTWAIGVRVAMTLYIIPSSAMLPEITSGYDERTSLMSYRYLFGWMGGLIAAQLGYLYFFAPSPQFADGRLDPSAYGAFALTGAIIIIVTLFLSCVGTHSLIAYLRAPTQVVKFSFCRLLHELRAVLTNYSALMLLVSGLFASTARGFQEVMSLYMGTYFWGLTTSQIAILVYAYMAATVTAALFARPLTQRFDKKRTVLGLALFTTIVGPLPVFLRLLGLMPTSGNATLMFLLLLHVFVIIAIVIMLQIVVASMVADTVDEHELSTGNRQEGIFFSAFAFTDKATFGLGGLFAGIALDLIAFPKGAQPDTVAPETVFNLGLVVGPGLMLLNLLSLVFVARYRITRESHQKIHMQLTHRPQNTATAS